MFAAKAEKFIAENTIRTEPTRTSRLSRFRPVVTAT
jgi:hypothetical protein